MRTARLLTAVLVLALPAAVIGAEPAGAATGGGWPRFVSPTVTTTSHVTAVCSISRPGPVPPETRDFTVVVTVPRRVSPGTTADIHVTVDFPVLAQVDAGGVSVDATQNGTRTRQLITVAPGSPNIDGFATVPVTGAAGSTIEWGIPNWGQLLAIGGTVIAETCLPTTPVVVPGTRIGGGLLARHPAIARLAQHVCNTPGSPHWDRRWHPFALLCALWAL